MTYFIKSFGGKRFNEKGEHTGPGDWLDVIWEANRLTKTEPPFFGRPTSTENGIEVYAHAIVIHKPGHVTVTIATRDPGDTLVTIESRDSYGADVLTAAYNMFMLTKEGTAA